VVNDVTLNVISHPEFWFWPAVSSGRWEPQTFAIMDRLLKPGWRFVDIGAWIGPTTLYAANKCDAVDAYECDPVAISTLKANLAANPNIIGKIALHEHALGPADGFVRMYAQTLGDSETSVFERHERGGKVRDCAASVLVGMRDILAVFRESGYWNCGRTLIKIDVEGAEYQIIPRLRELISDSRCVWYLSLHPINLNPEILPPKFVRVAETINVLYSFERLSWYNPSFHRINKEKLIQELLSTGLSPNSLIFCNGDLPGAI
jgi:FkbM family methyltransferase